MDSIDRRHFVGASVGLAAGMAASSVAEGADINSAAANNIPPPTQVVLGETGVRLSRLGLGTGLFGGNRQSDQTRMGFERFVELCRHAYNRGITFFDLADLYGSHVYFREVLRAFPREEVSILTKIWWKYDGPVDRTSDANRAQTTEATLQRFRHELNTDYIDIVLLHCLTDPGWTSKMGPYMETLSRHKEQGTVKAVGVSCHDFGAMKAAVAEPWVDVILARINPRGVKMDASPEEVVALLREAKARGKSVLGMKIFGEGQLVDEREECIRYAMEHDFMDAMTIGFMDENQIDEVLSLMAKHATA